MAVKMELKDSAIQILMEELQLPGEMLSIYLMALGTEMSENVTKVALTKVIYFLCQKLGWIKEAISEGMIMLILKSTSLDILFNKSGLGVHSNCHIHCLNLRNGYKLKSIKCDHT